MLQGLAGVVLDVVFWAVIGMAVYAFIHAAIQRPDAYPAVDKLTKPVWLLILGISIGLAFVLSLMGPVIAACASGVYLVDVRPKLLEVQGKSR